MGRLKLSELYNGSPSGQPASLSRPWYVTYYANGESVRTKGGINKGDTIKERNRLARELMDDLDAMILEKNNQDQEPEVKKVKIITLREGLDWAIDECKPRWKKGSLKEYTGPLALMYKVTDRMGLTDKDIKNVTRVVMREVLKGMAKERGTGDYMFIKNKTNLGLLFEELVDWEKIEVNPCHFRTPVKRPKPKPKVLLTPEQRILVKKQILNHVPNMWPYLMVINMSTIRPDEIYKIRVGDVDLKNSEIILRSDNVKDKTARISIIPDVLKPHLEAMNLSKFPNGYYLFGIDFTPEKRKQPVHRDKATKTWNYWIISKKTGLGINSKMYWLKHMGLTEMGKAGMSTDAIKEHAGHSSYELTYSAYVDKDRADIKEQIKTKTPDLF